MNWRIEELIFELGNDLERRILFVEGCRDVSFWKSLIPQSERENTEIYPISVIEFDEINGLQGGERGRLLYFASFICNHFLSARFLFFVDADYDKILLRECPDNVLFTDGRDLESYALDQECLQKIIIDGLAKDSGYSGIILDSIINIAKPIALLRIASEKEKLRLPFQKTIETKGISRFVEGKPPSGKASVNKFIDVLVQNSGLGLKYSNVLYDFFQRENKIYGEYPIEQIIHGKDFTFSLSWALQIDRSHAESCIFMSINKDTVSEKENVKKVMKWIIDQIPVSGSVSNITLSTPA